MLAVTTVRRSRLVPLALVALLLVAAVPATAAPRCYEEPCDWDRAAEAHVRDRAQADGGAHVQTAPFMRRPADGLVASDRLTVARNVSYNGTHWDLLVRLDLSECVVVAEIAALEVPGYRGVAMNIGRLPGVSQAAGAAELTVCGSMHVGFPNGSLARTTGAQLRVQTATELDVGFNLSHDGIQTFPMWTGLVATVTLTATRTPEAVRVQLEQGLHLLVDGELGYGSGTIRLDLLQPGAHRSIVVADTPVVGCSASWVDVRPAEARAGLCVHNGTTSADLRSQRHATEVVGTVHDGSGGRADPGAGWDTCLEWTGSWILCEKLVMVGAFPAIFADRGRDAYATGVRVSEERDVTAVVVERCGASAASLCTSGPAGAWLTVAGTPTDPDVVGTVRWLDEQNEEIRDRLEMATLGQDLADWTRCFLGACP